MFFKGGTNDSNLLRDTECLACFGFPHGVFVDRLNGERSLKKVRSPSGIQ
ncbi:MAG: hypothetical protein LDL41_17810 [Coleofasciculus sp. S288]|nr:hypothetical protein [Coleofasciculus sp. S288]